MTARYGYQSISVIKAAASPKQGSDQTTKTPTLKRGSSDSGNTASQSHSSTRKFVRTWLKDFPWLTYDFEGNAFCNQMSQALKKHCTDGFFFVEFSGITNCILNMSAYNAFYK